LTRSSLDQSQKGLFRLPQPDRKCRTRDLRFTEPSEPRLGDFWQLFAADDGFRPPFFAIILFAGIEIRLCLRLLPAVYAGPNVKRATPFFDHWIEVTERKLARRGSKAELARYLSEKYGRPARSWESNIAKIIARNLIPNAEIFLAIDGWIGRQKGWKRKHRR
jgi:hypothetical protein